MPRRAPRATGSIGARSSMSASMYSTYSSAMVASRVQCITAAGLLYEPDDSPLCGLGLA